jgi:hypothetical protein
MLTLRINSRRESQQETVVDLFDGIIADKPSTPIGNHHRIKEIRVIVHPTDD